MAAGVLDVGRKPKAEAGQEEAAAPDQYNLKIPDVSLARRLHAAYRALGLDGANFLRMMVVECLPIYEGRAARSREGKPPADYTGPT